MHRFGSKSIMLYVVRKISNLLSSICSAPSYVEIYRVWGRFAQPPYYFQLENAYVKYVCTYVRSRATAYSMYSFQPFIRCLHVNVLA